MISIGLVCALVACGLACGDAKETDELGTLEQEYTVRSSWGFRTDVAAPQGGSACLPPTSAPATQVCNYPTDRTTTFQCQLFDSAERNTLCETIVDQEVIALNDQYGSSGWAFGRAAGGGDITITDGNVGGAATLTDMRGYVNIAPNATAATPEASTYNGTYRRFGNANIIVDWNTIDANFTIASGDNLRVKAHSIGFATSLATGLGGIASPTRKNSTTITAGTAKVTNHSAADQCRVKAYDPTNANLITISGTCI